MKAAKDKLNRCLKRNFHRDFREPQYKGIPPRILCEKYLVDESGTELKDYKFFCFHGVPRIIQVNYNRFIRNKKNLYDLDWNYLPVALNYPTDPNFIIAKPARLDDMIRAAKTLSQAIPFVRVDFYSIGDRVYFGELTFTPASGCGKFDPEEFDFEMGSWLQLPKKKK